MRAASGVLIGVLLMSPAFASATPLEEKQREQAEIQAQLADARNVLAAKVQHYVELGKELERADAEVSQTASDLASMDEQLIESERLFTERAVQLYRTDKTSMLDILLSSETVKDFMARAYYMIVISEYDARMITQVRQARAENLWLKQSLERRIANLKQLQRDADDRREEIEDDIEQLEKQAEAVGADVIDLMRMQDTLGTGSSATREFDPDTIISETLFRDTSMATTAAVQAFLDDQPGVLKSRRFKDINGEVKPASVIIAEAAVAHGISPRVLLVKLQKEQSLLSRANPSEHTLNWAMGYGATDSGRIGKYSGFGKQIWYSAKGLAKISGGWHPGVTMKIDGNTVRPTNGATYALYKYTPHMHGNISFWMLYWRYFGDPLGT